MSEIREKWLQFSREISRIIADYQILAIAQDGEALLRIHREQNRILTETLVRQKRELDLLAGEKIEPVTHYAEVVLKPAFGIEP